MRAPGGRSLKAVGVLVAAIWAGQGVQAQQARPSPDPLDRSPSTDKTPLSPSVPLSATPAQAPPSAPARERQAPPVWKLEIHAPKPLDELLRAYLDLSRFQQESSRDPSSPISRSELRRLVNSAPEQARALIEAEGFFSSTITTRVSDEKPGQPLVVSLNVDPGEKTRVNQLQMVFEGELDTRLSNNDPQAMQLVSTLTSEWGVGQGKVFRQSDWSASKNSALARLRADGYPTAAWSGTSATVDAQARTAKLFLVADTGPAFAFGDIRIEGLNRQPASVILNLSPFQRGNPYRERDLLDLQERIQKLDLFDNVFVSPDLDPARATDTPVVVQVRELPLQQATSGIGASSNTGPRVSLEHLHRNIMSLDWQAKTKLQLGRDESIAQLDLTSHPWPGRRRGLVSALASYEVDFANTVTTSQRLRVGQLREGERLERTDYLEFQRALVRSSTGQTVSQASSLSGTSQWVLRRVDNQILPTKGTTTTMSTTLGRTFSTLDASGYFGRAYGRLTWYYPLPAKWYATVRGEAGQIVARDAVSVPDTLLFRAGGDESVRGYAYRSLGVERDGVTVGARAMTTSSVELARPFLQRFPSLWGAVFMDAGDAKDRFSDMRLKVGYGVGLRWRSPVGPLKLDLAYGAEVHQVRLHFTVGISL